MSQELKDLIRENDITKKRVVLWSISAVIMVAVSFAVLYVAYHTQQTTDFIASEARHLWAYLPGLHMLILTDSPTAVLVVSVFVWTMITRKRAWIKFKYFCISIWKYVTDVISLSLAAGLAAVVSFTMLYTDLQSGEGKFDIAVDLLFLQATIGLWIVSVRYITIPWIKFHFSRLNIKLDAVEELRNGKNARRNREIQNSVEVEKEGGQQWQKQLSLF